MIVDLCRYSDHSLSEYQRMVVFNRFYIYSGSSCNHWNGQQNCPPNRSPQFPGGRPWFGGTSHPVGAQRTGGLVVSLYKPIPKTDPDETTNLSMSISNIWRCPKIGLPPVIIHIFVGFSLTTTIQRSWGTPMTSWKPPWLFVFTIVNHIFFHH